LKLVECVPNFSEGRRKEIIDAVVAEARTGNVKVLDIESDVDHNRSVLTFVGDPVSVRNAALAVSAKAIELIDLNKHQGQHPRMGAVDVIPFIPVSNVTMAECIQLAKDFASEFATRFNVPVYLYEEAATRPDRRNLADVRKGEFEGLRNEIGKNPERKPDFGPDAIHLTAGATAIGARQILIAYNVNLATNNLDVAKKLAKQVRGKDGGLTAVKALGFELKDRGIVQVSMNIVDYKASQLFKAFELIKTLAKSYGVEVLESEVVGLIPMEALTDSAQFYLRLRNFDKHQILESKLAESAQDRLVERSVGGYVAELASEKPAPGGGSASALAGSLAASLVSMVSRLTLKRPEHEQHSAQVKRILQESEALQNVLLSLVDEDSRSFTQLMQAYRLPKEREEEKRTRSAEIQKGLKGAAEVPMKTAEKSADALRLAKTLAAFGNLNALSDVQTAAHLAYAASQGAISNVSINLASIKDEDYKRQMSARLEPLRKQVETEKQTALELLTKRTTKK
jgi:glutamate formiminotransferase/formiminotetrahydrofolate cyclodeaminase